MRIDVQRRGTTSFHPIPVVLLEETLSLGSSYRLQLRLRVLLIGLNVNKEGAVWNGNI